MSVKSYKILGQSMPAANTQEVLYEVPSGMQAVVSVISACSQSSEVRSFSVAFVPPGETLSQKHYVVFEKDIVFKETEFLKYGFTLDSGTKIYACSIGDTSFSAFGSEFPIPGV